MLHLSGMLRLVVHLPTLFRILAAADLAEAIAADAAAGALVPLPRDACLGTLFNGSWHRRASLVPVESASLLGTASAAHTAPLTRLTYGRVSGGGTGLRG